MKLKGVLLGVSLASAVTGCSYIINEETWVDRGHTEFEEIPSGRKACYTDANMIDGIRRTGTICASPTSKFFGGGEPRIEFSPHGRRFMSALESEAVQGVSLSRNDIMYFLKCTRMLSEKGEDIGLDCNVDANDQHLVSASYVIKK